MTAYLVATLARYVLVDATNENEARERGRAALVELYGGRESTIRTVRPATSDEIELMGWHREMVAHETR